MQSFWRKNPNGGGHQPYPDTLIIHAMSEFVIGNDGKVRHATEHLEHDGTSVHAMVTPSGDIIRTRPDNRVAYHCRGHNVNSLGVEVLVAGAYDWGTFVERIKREYVKPDQFDCLVDFVRGWRGVHPTIKHIKRHSDINPNKPDVGAGFHWERFLKEVAI